MRVLKRTLTRKSILGFGWSSIRDLSVQQIIDLEYAKYLINAYYYLEKIDFTDDILTEIGITKEIRIEKPGKVDFNSELVKTAKNNYYSKFSEEKRLSLLSRSTKMKKVHRNKKEKSMFDKKDVLRAKNHGNIK